MVIKALLDHLLNFIQTTDNPLDMRYVDAMEFMKYKNYKIYFQFYFRYHHMKIHICDMRILH